MMHDTIATSPWEPTLTGKASSAHDVVVEPRAERWPRELLLADAIETTMNPTPTAWLAESLDRLDSLAALHEDWDGEGGPPVSREMLESAAYLVQWISVMWGNANVKLPVPHAAPISGGAMQLEWRAHRRYLEIEFVTAAQVRVLARKGRSIRSFGTVDLFKAKFRRLLRLIS